jgi:uncharacterized protein (DUF427 family)
MIDYTKSVPIPETASSGTQRSYSTRHTGEVRALFRGHLIAASDKVMVVRPQGEPAQYYFPPDAVEMSVLQPNDRTDTSALGEARYFTLYRDREILEDGAWSYSGPTSTVGDIADMIAFNPQYVDIEIDSPQVATESPVIDDYIRHTDSGSGRSQEEAWDPTVGRPGEGA